MTYPLLHRRDFLKSAAALSLATLGGVTRLDGQTTLPGDVQAARKEPFILGADVSWVLEDEQQGAVYFDRGVQKDIFKILKSYQFNWIRIRVFIEPHAPGGYSARRSEAFCDLEHTVKVARRIKDADLKFLLSIHYSDTWSSPGHQAKPSAWVDLPYPKLVQAVHDWTANALKTLRENNTAPDMVSVGNETSSGMLFPDGRSPEKFAELINAGCTAVRAFDRKVPIAVHHHLGRQNQAIRPWVDNFLQHKTDFDIIGMSCYNEAQRGDWQNNFNDLARRYPQLGFLAMECSYQKQYLNDLLFNAPNARGLGSFLWEPTRRREAIFDRAGKNAGADNNNRPHLPASTLPPLDVMPQPTYVPATAPTGEQNADTPPPRRVNPASLPTTRGTNRVQQNNGGRYDTNSFMLAYPQFAKRYRITTG